MLPKLAIIPKTQNCRPAFAGRQCAAGSRAITVLTEEIRAEGLFQSLAGPEEGHGHLCGLAPENLGNLPRLSPVRRERQDLTVPLAQGVHLVPDIGLCLLGLELPVGLVRFIAASQLVQGVERLVVFIRSFERRERLPAPFRLSEGVALLEGGDLVAVGLGETVALVQVETRLVGDYLGGRVLEDVFQVLPRQVFPTVGSIVLDAVVDSVEDVFVADDTAVAGGEGFVRGGFVVLFHGLFRF